MKYLARTFACLLLLSLASACSQQDPDDAAAGSGLAAWSESCCEHAAANDKSRRLANVRARWFIGNTFLFPG